MDKTTKGFIKFTENGIVTKPFEGQSGFIEVLEKTDSPSDLLFITHNGGRYKLKDKKEVL
jgi:hypothetical protein